MQLMHSPLTFGTLFLVLAMGNQFVIFQDYCGMQFLQEWDPSSISPDFGWVPVVDSLSLCSVVDWTKVFKGMWCMWVSQLAMGCVTCHTHHGCVTDFRPILGNPMEVTHVTSLGHIYIFPC